jgi:hypothetical protein
MQFNAFFFLNNNFQMKEPLVSMLTIPHASPLYHTGNNIFMKYN